MYLYALGLLRLSGKRSIGDLSAMDFIVALIVGDMFDTILWGTSPLSAGLVGLGSIILLHTLVTFLTWRSNLVDRLLGGSQPAVVVENGRWRRAVMDSQRTSEEDVRSAMRLMAEDRLGEVKQAAWEPNGRLSVLRKPDAKPAQKMDRERLE